jgi:hypothetical protein
MVHSAIELRNESLQSSSRSGKITWGEKAYRVICEQFCDTQSRLLVACTAVFKGFKAMCEFLRSAAWNYHLASTGAGRVRRAAATRYLPFAPKIEMHVLSKQKKELGYLSL